MEDGLRESKKCNVMTIRLLHVGKSGIILFFAEKVYLVTSETQTFQKTSRMLIYIKNLNKQNVKELRVMILSASIIIKNIRKRTQRIPRIPKSIGEHPKSHVFEIILPIFRNSLGHFD